MSLIPAVCLFLSHHALYVSTPIIHCTLEVICASNFFSHHHLCHHRDGLVVAFVVVGRYYHHQHFNIPHQTLSLSHYHRGPHIGGGCTASCRRYHHHYYHHHQTVT